MDFYSVFYYERPNLDDDIRNDIAYIKVRVGSSGYWHFYVPVNLLDRMPSGWVKYNDLPADYKKIDGSPLLSFMSGDVHINNGGFG